jgi:hypothetical protein
MRTKWGRHVGCQSKLCWKDLEAEREREKVLSLLALLVQKVQRLTPEEVLQEAQKLAAAGVRGMLQEAQVRPHSASYADVC